MKNQQIKFSFSDYFEPIEDYWGSKCSNNQDNYDNLPDTEKALHLDMLIKYYGAEALNEKELSDAHRLLDIVAITKSNNLANKFVGFGVKFLVVQSMLQYIVRGVNADSDSDLRANLFDLRANLYDPRANLYDPRANLYDPRANFDLLRTTTSTESSIAIGPDPLYEYPEYDSQELQVNVSADTTLSDTEASPLYDPGANFDLLRTTTSTESSIAIGPDPLYEYPEYDSQELQVNVSADTTLSNTEASPTVGLSWLEWSGIVGTISVVLSSIGYGGYYIIKRYKSNHQAHDNVSNNDANQSDLGLKLAPVYGTTTDNNDVGLIDEISNFYTKEKFTTNQSLLVAEVFHEGLHCNSVSDVTNKFKNIFAKLDLNGVATLIHIVVAHNENLDGAIANVDTIRYPATWENMPTKDFLAKYHIANPYRSFDKLICDANEQQTVLMIGDECMSLLNQAGIG